MKFFQKSCFKIAICSLFLTFFLSPPISAQTRVSLVPNLVITKKVDKQETAPGDTLHYTISYANVLSDTAYNTRIIDVLPEKSIFTPELNPGWQLNQSQDSIFYDLGELAPQESDSIQIQLIVMAENSFTPGSHNLLNVAEIRGEYNSRIYRNKDAAISSLFLMPDVQVKKSHNPPFMSTWQGDTLFYQVVVTNHGNNSALDVVVLDTLTYLLQAVESQPAISSKSWVTDQPVPQDTILQWIIPVVAPNSSDTIQIKTVLANYDLLGIDKLVNRVGVHLTDEENVMDNHAADTTYFGGGGPAVRDLVILKTDNQDTARPGDLLTYEITYKNDGNLYTRDIKIAEHFPAFTTLQDFVFSQPQHLQSYQEFVGGIDWYLTMLAPGDSGIITLNLAVSDSLPIGQHDLVDSVHIESSTLGETNPDNNTAVDITRVQAGRDLEIQKTSTPDTVGPGEIIAYSLQYRNIGNMTAEQVILKDSLGNKDYIVDIFDISAGGQLLQDSSLILWDIGEILPDQGSTVTFKVKVKEFSEFLRQQLFNYVQISTPDTEATLDNNFDTTLTWIYYQPILEMKITHAPANMNPGDLCDYAILYRNSGTAEAKATVLQDTIPPYLHFTGDTTSFLSWNVISTDPAGMDSVIQFDLGNLPPRMTNWEEINIYTKLDSMLPGTNMLLVNHGSIWDSNSFSARDSDSLFISGPLFDASLQIIPMNPDPELPEKSLYLGSQYKIRVEVSKPLVSGMLQISYPGLGTSTQQIPMEQINDDFIYETSILSVPGEAGFGSMTAEGNLTSVFQESAHPSDAATIVKPPEEFHLNRNVAKISSGEVVRARFTLSRPEQATVKIYTISGEMVCHLYDKKFAVAGEDQVDWDGRNDNGQLVSSGVYLVYLQTPSFEKVKKVIIVR